MTDDDLWRRLRKGPSHTPGGGTSTVYLQIIISLVWIAVIALLHFAVGANAMVVWITGLVLSGIAVLAFRSWENRR